MEEKDIVAQNIATYRKKAGLSQLELAQRLQYSNKNISKWENGETTPSVFTLKKIADIFGITVDDLLKSGEEPATTEAEKAAEEKLAKTKAKRKKIHNYIMLVLANAILFSVACVAIYVLELMQVQNFNAWLLLLYIQPLVALSVFIFIRCVYKHMDIVSLSLVGWLIAVCVYVSFLDVPNIALSFVLAGAYQIVVTCIVILINLKLIDKFAEFFKTKVVEKKIKKSTK
jgi:transcriptional regulator with XRE-family HTH domain